MRSLTIQINDDLSLRDGPDSLYTEVDVFCVIRTSHEIRNLNLSKEIYFYKSTGEAYSITEEVPCSLHKIFIFHILELSLFLVNKLKEHILKRISSYQCPARCYISITC